MTSSSTPGSSTAPSDQAALAAAVGRRRNFAIISHPDAGKTTLTEKLLLYGGAIQQAGAVKAKGEQRKVTSDWMELEKQRGISITSTVLQFDYSGSTINLLDTPGHKDFSEDTYRVLTAVDSALMVIDAANGVESQTRRLIEVCRQRDTPILTFVNKMDREVKDPLALMDEIERELGMTVVPFTWPVGMAKFFGGVLDLRKDQMRVFSPGEDRVAGTEEIVDGLVEPAVPLEYELTRSIRVVSNAARKRIGISAFPTLYVLDPTDQHVAIRWLGSANVAQLERLLDDGELAVASEPLEVHAGDVAEALDGRHGVVECFQCGAALGDRVVHRPFEEREEQIVFALEVQVDRSGGDIGMSGHGPDLDLAAFDADSCQALDLVEIHNRAGLGQAQLHGRNQALAAGQYFGVAVGIAKKLNRMFQRSRLRIGKWRRLHVSPPGRNVFLLVLLWPRTGERQSVKPLPF